MSTRLPQHCHIGSCLFLPDPQKPVDLEHSRTMQAATGWLPAGYRLAMAGYGWLRAGYGWLWLATAGHGWLWHRIIHDNAMAEPVTPSMLQPCPFPPRFQEQPWPFPLASRTCTTRPRQRSPTPLKLRHCHLAALISLRDRLPVSAHAQPSCRW